MKKDNNIFLNNAANFVTLLNMVCGSMSIVATMNGKYKTAIAMIWIAAIADRYDGIVARMLGTSSDMGVQMDSMGDIISFGVAPSVHAYNSVFLHAPNNIKLLGGIATVMLICAGALRLARYNIVGLDEDNSFMGLPITIGGSLLAVLLIFRRNFAPVTFVVVMIILSILELSKIRIKKR